MCILELDDENNYRDTFPSVKFLKSVFLKSNRVQIILFYQVTNDLHVILYTIHLCVVNKRSYAV